MANSRSKRRHREPFAILAPHTLNVSQTVIRKKWKKLPANWQQKVKQLIQSIGRSSHSRGGKHGNSTGSQTAVENVLELYVQTSLHHFRRSNTYCFYRLTRRVPRMPFPPKTEEVCFDFEAILCRTVSPGVRNFAVSTNCDSALSKLS